MPTQFRSIIRPTAWVAFALLWLAAGLCFLWIFNARLLDALLAGLGIACLHWAALVTHHAGHALAAARTGFPMSGIYFWWFLATSLYPRDEPDLAPEIHVRRAWGGPAASAVLGLISLFVAVWMRASGYDGWLLAAFLAADCLLIFTLGSLLPLSFNDGGTLRRYNRKSGS